MCPRGWFQSNTKSTSCIACVAKKFSGAIGASSSGVCEKCSTAQKPGTGYCGIFDFNAIQKRNNDGQGIYQFTWSENCVEEYRITVKEITTYEFKASDRQTFLFNYKENNKCGTVFQCDPGSSFVAVENKLGVIGIDTDFKKTFGDDYATKDKIISLVKTDGTIKSFPIKTGASGIRNILSIKNNVDLIQ